MASASAGVATPNATCTERGEIIGTAMILMTRRLSREAADGTPGQSAHRPSQRWSNLASKMAGFGVAWGLALEHGFQRENSQSIAAGAICAHPSRERASSTMLTWVEKKLFGTANERIIRRLRNKV